MAHPTALRRYLPAQFRGVLKHLLAVPGEMFGVEDRQLDIVFLKEVQQSLLALNLRQLSEIPVTPQEIEGVIHQPALPSGGEFGLKF